MKVFYLYVKESPTGLLYLGKTEQDPYIYLGSGKIWKLHLKKHKYTSKDIKTWIIHETTSKSELVEIGKIYSDLLNVVESENWANLKPEEGDGGSTNIGKKLPGTSRAMKSYMIGNTRGVKNKGRVSPMRGKVGAMKGHQGAMLGKSGSDHPASKAVIGKSKIGIEEIEFDTCDLAGKYFNIHPSNITKCCKGKQKSAAGYTWNYKN